MPGRLPTPPPPPPIRRASRRTHQCRAITARFDLPALLRLCRKSDPETEGDRRQAFADLLALCHGWNDGGSSVPTCGEEHVEKLAVYIARSTDTSDVEAMRHLPSYLKTIDMTKEGGGPFRRDELRGNP